MRKNIKVKAKAKTPIIHKPPKEIKFCFLPIGGIGKYKEQYYVHIEPHGGIPYPRNAINLTTHEVCHFEPSFYVEVIDFFDLVNKKEG